MIATEAVERVNQTVDYINDHLDDSVDLILDHIDVIKGFLGPLATQLYGPVLLMDLDYVINSLNGLTDEVQNVVYGVVDNFNARIRNHFDTVFSRLDCISDEKQFEQTITFCVANLEITLDSLKYAAIETEKKVSENVSTLINLIAECRGKSSPILRARCAATNCKKVVSAAESIQNVLEDVSQTLSSNIQELALNFESCSAEC